MLKFSGYPHLTSDIQSYKTLSIQAEALNYSKMSFCCILAWPEDHP